ncbi:SurA N-terminal domain-containing protein [Pseudomonadota bacterium]|nr:SurA N-terminal domain-containing protein [Pseudomonadota bacterium]
MLQLIRDKSQGLIVGIIVFLISLTFALFGIQSYFTGQSDVTVAEVDSHKITLTDLIDRIKTIRQQTEDNLQTQTDPDLWSSDFIKLQTLNLMIDEIVLDQVIADAGIKISDDSLVKKLKDVDAFYDEDGFSRERYESLLARTGTTTKEFEASVASDVLRSHIKLGILGSEFSTDSENSFLFQLRNQKRDISLALIKIFPKSKDIILTEQELEEFYQQNRESYKTKEKLALEYLKLSRESIKGSLPKIEEVILRNIYTSNIGSYTTPETRSIEYLLIKENPTLEDKARSEIIGKIFSLLSDGKNLYEISQTIDGKIEIELDSVENLNRGDLPGPLDDAVFALTEAGVVSKPIDTEFGTHVVKLNVINPAKTLSFDDVKSQIMEDEFDRRTEQVYVESAELMAELAFENPDSLDLVSSTLGLQRQETGLITKERFIVDFGASSVPKVFNDDVLDNKYNSEPVETAGDILFLFRVKKYEKAIIPELKDVRDKVEKDLTDAKLKDETMKFVDSIITELRESGGQSETFQKEKLSWKLNKSIDRYSEKIPLNVRNKAFAVELQNNNPHYLKIEYDESTIAIIRVHNQQAPAVAEAGGDELDKTRDFIIRPRSAVMWKDYLTTLRRDKKIKIYSSNLSP